MQTMKNEHKKTPDLIMFRVRPDVERDVALARRLRKAAEVTGISVSQMLRESAERGLKDLARRYPEIEAA